MPTSAINCSDRARSQCFTPERSIHQWGCPSPWETDKHTWPGLVSSQSPSCGKPAGWWPSQIYRKKPELETFLCRHPDKLPVRSL